jgi:hypothetical protein
LGAPDALSTYVPGNQPYNQNFASVLFELKAANVQTVSFSSLDYPLPGHTRVATNSEGGPNMQFLQSYRVSSGQNPTSFGEISLTDKLINGISK